MTAEEKNQRKKELRKEIKERMRHLAPDYCREADRQIIKQVMALPSYQKADTVDVYKRQIICRCEEITKGEIRQAVHDGMFTLTEVKRYLRTGMGLCQGQTCGRLVKNIVEKELSKRITPEAENTTRAPMRPIPMDTYGKEAE